VIALDPGTITTIQGVGFLDTGIRFVSRAMWDTWTMRLILNIDAQDQELILSTLSSLLEILVYNWLVICLFAWLACQLINLD
jgi:hypothetical protein